MKEAGSINRECLINISFSLLYYYALCTFSQRGNLRGILLTLKFSTLNESNLVFHGVLTYTEDR
jgi:hypothetical protein